MLPHLTSREVVSLKIAPSLAFLFAALSINFAGGAPTPMPAGLLPPTAAELANAEARSAAIVPSLLARKAALPARLVNIEHLPPVRTQRWGTCASWAVVYYLKGWNEARDANVTRPLPAEYQLAPFFTFSQVRGSSVSEGTSFAQNLDFLINHGTVRLDQFDEWIVPPYSNPALPLWREAAARRSASWTSIMPNSVENLTAAKVLLNDHHLLVAGFPVTANVDGYIGDASVEGPGISNQVIYSPVGDLRAYHAFTIIGYDDDREFFNGTETRKGAFAVVNSWGANWWGVALPESGTEMGYCWIAYDAFLNGSNGGFPFHSLEERPPHTPTAFFGVDYEHPARAELGIQLVGGEPYTPLVDKTVLSAAGLVPVNVGRLTDITDEYQADVEVWRLRIQDARIPGYELSTGIIHDAWLELPGRAPVHFPEMPFTTVDFQDLTPIAPQEIVMSPIRRSATMPRTFGQLGASAVGDLDGDGLADCAMGDWLYRQQPDGSLAAIMRLADNTVYSLAFGDVDNDGRADVLIYGYTNDMFQPRLYRQTATGAFVEAAANLPQVQGLSLFDYDGDGDLDIVYTGGWHENRGGAMFAPGDAAAVGLSPLDPGGPWGDFDGDGDLDSASMEAVGIPQPGGGIRYETRLVIRRNDGGDMVLLQDNLGGMSQAVVTWADMNNDGRLDVIASGMIPKYITGNVVQQAQAKIYLQRPNGSFVDGGFPTSPRASGPMVVLDLGNDGDLDFICDGTNVTTSSGVWGAEVHENFLANEQGRANAAPSAPTALAAAPIEGEAGAVDLNWSAPSDDHTPSLSLRYHLRVGRTAGGSEICSPAGRAPEYLRLGSGQPGRTLLKLAAGTYHWSVRAADASGGLSPWAPEATFTVADGVAPAILGDANNDAVIDSADVRSAQRMVAGTTTPDAARADVDLSGAVNAPDEPRLASIIAGNPVPVVIAGVTPIGPAGGSITVGGFTLTVPPGAVEGDPAMIRVVPLAERPFGNSPDAGSGALYRVMGIPYGLQKPLEVRLPDEATMARTTAPLIAIGVEGFHSSLGPGNRTWEFVAPLRVEDGKYVYSLDPLPSPSTAKSTAPPVDGTYSTDWGVLGGYGAYTTDHFKIDYAANTDSQYVEALAQDLEDAYATFTGPEIGLSTARRTRTKIGVGVYYIDDKTFGYHEASLRGVNYDRIVVNSGTLMNAEGRRATAFHELFHLITSLYDPRNFYSRAKLLAPHYTMDEMTGPFAEHLAFPTKNDYIPSVYTDNRAAPFAASGWMTPEVSTGDPRVDTAYHAYGLSSAIRWLATERHEYTFLRTMYEQLYAGRPWTECVASAGPETGYIWLPRYYEKLVRGQIYSSFTIGDVVGYSGSGHLATLVMPTKQAADFTLSPTPLSASLYRVAVKQADLATLTDTDRLGFRLEGPAATDLGVISMTSNSRTFVDFASTGADDKMRLVVDKPLEVFSQQGGSFVAIVTNRSTTPIAPASLPVRLRAAVLRDATVTLPAWTVAPIFFGTTFPDMSVAQSTVLVPDTASKPTTRAIETIGPEVQADFWPTANRTFHVKLSASMTESSYTLPGGNRFVCAGIKTLRVRVNELVGDTMIPVQTIDVPGPEFDVPIHVKDGLADWQVCAVYDIREENPTTNAVVGTVTYEWALMSFFGTAN